MTSSSGRHDYAKSSAGRQSSNPWKHAPFHPLLIGLRIKPGFALNLPFNEWTEAFGSERLTGALLDRLTHHVHILEMNGESYRLKDSKSGVPGRHALNRPAV